MLNDLFGPHAGNLQRALDRTSMRHSLLTKNLANVNTPGYKRQDLDFATELERARQPLARSTRNADALGFRNGDNTNQLEPMAPVDRNGSVRIDGNSVDLEGEVVAIAETEIRYQTLTEMTSRYFSGLKNVIREGR
jgi:flagellar basal-body rod protein FlgB